MPDVTIRTATEEDLPRIVQLIRDGTAPGVEPDEDAGPPLPESYLAAFYGAGLRNLEVLSRSDYFSGSSSKETRKVAESFGAHAIVLRAGKP